MTRSARVACAIALLVTSCKTRGEPPIDAQDASMQRPLPVGMLAGSAPAEPASPHAGPARRLRAVRDAQTGSWVELQPAGPGESPRRTTFEHFRSGSLFVPLDAMTLLNDAFARALPGFDPLSPQLLDARALGRLRVELAALEKAWSSTPGVNEAQKRWPLSTLVRGLGTDAEWKEAQAALIATIEDVRRLATELEGKEAGLWVLAPR